MIRRRQAIGSIGPIDIAHPMLHRVQPIDRLRARGLPVHWLRVVATDEVSLPSSVRHTRIDHGVIDRGEAVAA